MPCDPMDDPNWRARLRAMRLARKKTQKDVADHLGVNRSHISSVENGTRGIVLEKYERWLEYLGHHVEVHPSAMGLEYTGVLIPPEQDPKGRARALVEGLAEVIPHLPETLLEELEDRLERWRHRYKDPST